MVTLVVDHFQVPLGGRRFWFEDCGKVEEKLTGTVKVTCDMIHTNESLKYIKLIRVLCGESRV